MDGGIAGVGKEDASEDPNHESNSHIDRGSSRSLPLFASISLRRADKGLGFGRNRWQRNRNGFLPSLTRSSRKLLDRLLLDPVEAQNVVFEPNLYCHCSLIACIKFTFSNGVFLFFICLKNKIIFSLVPMASSYFLFGSKYV